MASEGDDNRRIQGPIDLKVYEVVLEKNLEASKVKKEKYKSLALKARKVSSDKEESCSGCDEEYAMASRKRKRERRIEDASRCWIESDEEDESMKDEIYPMALDNNESKAKNELLNNEACALKKKLDQLEKNKEANVECET
ncbi:hypothetical protein Tco_1030041, partial [Tanacetum coccineum]